jgi:hypothetical protein
VRPAKIEVNGYRATTWFSNDKKLINDYVFQNPRMIGWSLALTVRLASLLSAILFYATRRPYQKHYAQMHA